MATQRNGSTGRAVLLACLVLALCGAVSHGGVIESHRESHHIFSREASVSETLRHLVRHRRDVEQSSAVSHWKALSTRLSAVLRLMRSRQTSSESTSATATSSAGLAAASGGISVTSGGISATSGDTAGRSRRDAGGRNVDDKIALEEELVREVHEAEERDGPARQTVEEKIALEEELVREVHEAEERDGPAHKMAQMKAFEKMVEQADDEAHRAVLARKYEQHREILREIAEIERKAGIPTDDEKLALEREIAQEARDAIAKEKARKLAVQRVIQGDIQEMMDTYLKTGKRTGAAAADAASSSEESGVSKTADAAADAAKDNDANSEEDDEDKVYDDAFGGDSSLVSPLDENGSDADILSNNNNNPSSSNSDSDNSKTPTNVKVSASETSNQGASSLKDASAGDHVSVQAAHSTWQVTLMTVIMCSLVGMVLLLVVGAWYKDLGSFRPGKPEHMLLEDDEHSVYHRTTQPEPRQVGTYAPLT